MKTIQAIVSILLITITGASAQVAVYDPVNHTQSVVNQAQSLAQYVQMVNNQIEQINTMTQELQQVTAYVKAFGDPATLLNIIGVDGLINSLNTTGIGQTIGELQNLADGVEALQYNANGLYQSVGQTFTTAQGTQVPRAKDLYKKFSAINKTAQNYNNVYDDVFARRKVIKGQLAQTSQRLQAATTDAETQKLTGVLVGQGAELEAIDKEIDFAASQTVLQDIQNRNDEEKQSQAQAEEIAADRQDSFKKFGTMMVPDVNSNLNFGGNNK